MKTKDVGLRIRVDRELRDAFVTACRSQEKPAAQVLREFMRQFVNDAQEKRTNESDGSNHRRPIPGAPR